MPARPIALTIAAGTLAAVLAAPVPPARALAPDEIVDAFEAVLGPVRTHRPSHPKGTCAAGTFQATAEGTRLSVAPVFNGQPMPAIIRFGVAGANPQASDVARSTRGLSFRLETPQGDLWDTASISAPIFGARTPEMLVAGLLARRPDPATGQPDPARVAAFVQANPESTLQGRWLGSVNPPASWATTPYWGVNTFLFRGQDGQVRPARWVFEPVAGTQRLTDEQMRTLGPNFLADEARRRVASGPIAYDMVLVFPGSGDDLINPTMAWPDDRPRTTVARLTVTSVEAGAGGACDPISFLNLEMDPGIAFSEDPTLHARTPPYAVSLSRRLQ